MAETSSGSKRMVRVALEIVDDENHRCHNGKRLRATPSLGCGGCVFFLAESSQCQVTHDKRCLSLQRTDVTSIRWVPENA